MSFLRPSKRQLARRIALCGALAGSGAGLALAASWAALARATGSTPTVSSNRHCYVVGAPVQLLGSGFAPARTFVVSIDGVYFGNAVTDAGGGFSTELRPGGLDAGVAQAVDHLEASDGTTTATTTFTVTRATGARLLATSGNPHTLRVPLEIWGFAQNGGSRHVYLHYVSPAGHVRSTFRLGHTGGQCGYLRTGSRRLFPFSPSFGRWTLQLDTRKRYASRPHGPVARIRVQIS